MSTDVIVNIHGAWFGSPSETGAGIAAASPRPRGLASLGLHRIVYAVHEVAGLERDYRDGRSEAETRGDWLARGGPREAMRWRWLRWFCGVEGARACGLCVAAFAAGEPARGAHLATVAAMATSVALAKSYRAAMERLAELEAFVDASARV